MKTEPTQAEKNAYIERMLAKFKQDPQFELKQELGRFLLRPIDSLTPEERKRYDELLEIVKD